MKILIVEDEPLAAEKLEAMIREYLPEVDVAGPFDSIRQTVGWLKKNDIPELAFFDIQLADGLSFEIFEQADVSFPVIFTTAFDEYALKAFKVNSVDYLLKPIDKEELHSSLKKYERLFKQPDKQGKVSVEAIDKIYRMITKNYRNRFLIRVGEHLRPLDVTDVVYFYSQQRATFVLTVAGKNYDLDFTLDQLEQDLDPELFFRVNRGALVRLDAIRDVLIYSGNRLRLKLVNEPDEPVLVSRERVGMFKQWLEGGNT
ncbi:DNA-binding response regulator [Prolixibacter bellariivorans]|uniref:DNA-binding response regulator n=1 Tax=Prolixibacter bellariivorans TaxID=314319 RepID=A0A5M4AWH7_9BACT|nr:LytTR family DNA-binding domain-containing protein [Prolixibacter bellariivorans]GET31946.1 DNA-binding response regulator [Prolixibacter bellariivorans]